jgi:triphosphoribosyl-dephospho-CoA synthetase
MGREIKMHILEQEIHSIDAAYRAGQLDLDERNYLLGEIRDIRAAQECADNEELFRYIVQACNAIITVA